ncbi:MAG TPA: hypothetical protein VN253_28685 [Kofleriaceae bacterium]|nr:hypothetical protein [Kofleriaceae bacterium]
MRARILVAALSVFLLGGLGCKGDRVKCEKAARNFSRLVYWQRHDAEIAKLPEAQRDAERKKLLAEYTKETESNIDFFVDQCASASNDDQVDCMIAAKTGDEALKCADLIKPE